MRYANSADLFIGITWREHKVSRGIASLDNREVEKKITVNRKMLALVTYECPLTSLAHISYTHIHECPCIIGSTRHQLNSNGKPFFHSFTRVPTRVGIFFFTFPRDQT